MSNFDKPKEVTGEAAYKLGLAISHKKHPDLPGQICPICKETFTAKWNPATGKYTRFNKRECARIANHDNLNLKL